MDGEGEGHALLHRKAGIRMGLCAPAVVAANAALEGSTAACRITGLEGVEAFFFFGKYFKPVQFRGRLIRIQNEATKPGVHPGSDTQ